MLTKNAEIQRLVLVRLNTGDDVLQSICKAVAENNIQTGVILSGVGSVSQYHFHVVENCNFPLTNVLVNGEGAHDILSITGLIIDGRVHAHITISNKDKALGGHMEEGCRILSFGGVILAETPDVHLTDWDKIGQL